MANPIDFPSTTVHLSFPLLFSGQAQKEPFINHSFSTIDALLTGVVNDSLAIPPSNPVEGSRYRVLASAADEWHGRDNDVAINVGGAWQFVVPHEGMSIFDSAAGQTFFFKNGAWQSATEPTPISGGSTIDSEARETIEALIEALKTAGIFVKSA